MANTATTNYGWVKPENFADDDLWGTHLNGDLDAIDATVFAISGVASGAATAASSAQTTANGALVKSANLSDLGNAVNARSNLKVAAVALGAGNLTTASANFLSLDLSSFTTYKRIEIQVEGLFANGTHNVLARLSANAGGSYIAAGYTSSTVIDALQSSYSGTSEIQTGISCSTVAGGASFSCDLMGINQAYQASVRLRGLTNSCNVVDSAGVLPGTTAINAVRLFLDAGTCSGGTYRVTGYL